MKYSIDWVDRGHIKMLKGTLSLRVIWRGNIRGWYICDIPKKPISTFEQRKIAAEQIVKRSFEVACIAIKSNLDIELIDQKDVPK